MEALSSVCYHLRSKALFWFALPPTRGPAPPRPASPLAGGHPELPVSAPKRALLELLSETSSFEDLGEVRQLVECTGKLRLLRLDLAATP